MLSQQNWVTVQEAADILGVTDGRVRQMLRDSELSGVKFGKTWALNKEEVEEFAKIERLPGNPNFRKTDPQDTTGN